MSEVSNRIDRVLLVDGSLDSFLAWDVLGRPKWAYIDLNLKESLKEKFTLKCLCENSSEFLNAKAYMNTGELPDIDLSQFEGIENFNKLKKYFLILFSAVLRARKVFILSDDDVFKVLANATIGEVLGNSSILPITVKRDSAIRNYLLNGRDYQLLELINYSNKE